MINTYSSYKGGIGKTTLTLASACYYLLNTDYNVTLIDCNNMNPDISRVIFNHFHMEESGTCNTLDGLPIRWMTTNFESQDRKFCLIDASHINPAEVITRYNGSHSHQDVILIDTNNQIREFISLPPPNINTGHISKDYIWFTWGWALPKADLALRDTISSTKAIERHFPHRCVVHVFNIYDLFNVRGSIIRRSSKTIEPLNRVINEINRRHSRAITKHDCIPEYYTISKLSPMLMKIREELMQYQSPRDVNIEELPSIWGHYIMELLEDNQDNVPYNILVIPTFYEELVMTMERLIMGSPRSIKEIRGIIRPIADYIENWTDNLRLYDTFSQL